MRLIPGKTKVQIELFKGISLGDVLIGGIGIAMVLLVLFSSLPYKLAISIGIFVITGLMIVRLDTEPNYIMVLNILKHFAYARRYEKVYDDEMILKKSDGTIKEEYLKQYHDKQADGGEFLEEDVPSAEEEAPQPKTEMISEKELIKRENKILKSKKATAEQKDAVWLARAKRSAAKKEAKKNGEQPPKLFEVPVEEEAPAKDSKPMKKKGKAAPKEQAGAAGEEGSEALQDNAEAGESPAEKKAKAKEAALSEKELIKRENEILKSKTATQEEKDAVWLARAKRSAAKKEAQKQAKNEQAENADYDFMENIMAFTGIKDDLIEYGGKYYGTVIEIDPVEFRFFSQHRRNNSIELGVGRVLRSIHVGFAANIVKLERPIIYDKYLAKEKEKLEQLRKSYESGMMNEEELQARVDIENDRLAELKGLCTDKQVVAPFYYIALFESDKKQLELQTKDAMDALGKGEMTVRRLNTKELAVFLKYTNQIDFNERDIDKYKPEDYAQWAMPQRVTVKYRTVEVNNIVTHNFRVVKYPAWVDDAWLANVLSLPATKVVVKCSPMDRSKAIRTIDRSLQELRGQYNATGVDSKRIELESHINTLSDLLATLQGEGEELLECNIYVTAYDVQNTRLARGLDELNTLLPEISAMKKTVRRAWQENNFRLNDHFFNQMSAFIGSQVSAYDPEAKNGRGIPSNSLAACYPWVYAHISDEGGFKLGSSGGVPVFINFFRRDSERVNSNMVIIGKSGSGKSYATKSILSNLASEDAKIFILDPENEYSELAQNLHGKVINVANAQYGRLNPFHIITALDDDEEGGGAAGSFSTHLQFLEEFYRQILPEIEKDALEYLNNLTERLYTNRGITPESDLSKLRPEDYPIFDDLYDAVLEEFERTDNEYIRSMLRTLVNYVAKFATGGRNSNIWNGPSTVTTDENFTVFNFQAMLSNRNTTIANAQMLLVLKYIDNEIIKNRDYNSKYGLKRKVVVVIDEAHVFIDAKFPIALDFMFQLAKRIRKYNGMQIVITQNIKDFVGSEEIARKSTAIINACQYSFIFALAPNDMHDLCTLYEKAGGISEIEQEQIIQAPRGQAFTVMSATSRSTFKVEVPKNMVDMFQDRDFHSRYYTGTEGAAAWEEFVGPSRKAHDKNKKANKKASVITIDDVKQQNSWVRFEELTEDPVELPTLKPKKPKKSSHVSFDEIDETDDFGMSDEDMDAMIAQHMTQKEAEKLKGIEAKVAEADAKKKAEAQADDEFEEETDEIEIDEIGAALFDEEESDETGETLSDEEESDDLDAMLFDDEEDEESDEAGVKRFPETRTGSKGFGETQVGAKKGSVTAAATESVHTQQTAAQTEDSAEVIGQLKDVLVDFVQAVRQPLQAAVPATPIVQEQPKVDVAAIVADVRKQVMAQIMDEIQAGGIISLEEYRSRVSSEEDEDLDLFEADLDDEENAEEDEDLLALEAVLEDDTESEDFEELPPESDEDELDMSDLLDGESEEESEDEESEDEEEEYDFDDLFSSDESEEEASDDEEDDDGFDVMKMLRMEAKAIVEQKQGKIDQDVELADYAEEGGIADITLEDLAKIVTTMRKRKRAK